MVIYAYIRVSRDSQVESGAGINAQIDACNEWANKHNDFVLKHFVDDATSGATPLEKRPILQEAITALHKGDTLLVARRDRLGRSPNVTAVIEAEVYKRRAQIKSVIGEGTDGDDASSIMVRRMTDAFSEFERNFITERISAAMKAKKARNERVGKIPFGKRLQADGVHLEDCPDEMAIIDEMRTLRAKDTQLWLIADKLNEKGMQNRTRLWNMHSVHYLLQRFN